MTEKTVALSLGSNKACALKNGESLAGADLLRAAFLELSAVLKDARVSSLYKTKPMYVTDQSDFFNAVVCGKYRGAPDELLAQTQRIEAAFGRDRAREIRNGSRALDIDIVLFGEERVREPRLDIPHPRMYERAFVLVPLLELLPESADPITEKPFSAFLKKLPDQGVVRYGVIMERKYDERRQNGGKFLGGD